MPTLDEDLEALRALQKDLWPAKHKNGVVHLEASRLLTFEEFRLIFGAIKRHKLVVEMFSSDMFGGYGINIYAHEQFPGTGSEFVLRTFDGHFPSPMWQHRPTLFERLDGKKPPLGPACRKRPGEGRDDVWELLSKFSHSEENQRFLKQYRLRKSEPRYYYDY